MTPEDQLSGTLFHLNKFDPLMHATNAKLMGIILQNIAEIEANPHAVNKAFGLHLAKPTVMLGLEMEFLCHKSQDDLGKIETKITSHKSIEGGTIGEAIKELNLEFEGETIIKFIRDDKMFKHELRTIEPAGAKDQLYNYARLFTAVDIGMHRLLQRFSSQLDVSVCDKECHTPFPLDNEDFRKTLGMTIAKFMDEGLVLLDTKKSIEGHLKDKDPKDKFYNETDRMEYYDGNTELLRCMYQICYRNEDKPVDDNAKGIVLKSTSRDEIRRTAPGECHQNNMVCDPILAAFALTSSAINYVFKNPKMIEMQPYNYRGTEYTMHMSKFKKSELLDHTFDSAFREELAKKIMVANIMQEQDESPYHGKR